MAMMASCETPAMEGEDAAASLLEEMTVVQCRRQQEGRGIHPKENVSQWVHLTHRSLGLLLLVSSKIPKCFISTICVCVLAMVVHRNDCLCVFFPRVLFELPWSRRLGEFMGVQRPRFYSCLWVCPWMGTVISPWTCSRRVPVGLFFLRSVENEAWLITC